MLSGTQVHSAVPTPAKGLGEERSEYCNLRPACESLVFMWFFGAPEN